MKTLYFVRHAQSEGNIGPLQQGFHTPLTEEGLKQASFIADRFTRISFDKIIASPQMRAKQTAEAIAKSTGKEIEFSDLLIERKNPSSFVGMKKGSPEWLEVYHKMRELFHEKDKRHSDEENAHDLRTRAVKLLEYIETIPEERIVLVSHGVFMRMVVAVVLMGKEVTTQEYRRFYIGLAHNNTGITIIKQIAFEKEPPVWKLISWNDHAHLGETSLGSPE